MTPVARIYTTSSPTEREEGIAAATGALRRGELVILPTDTVYGIAADAFSPLAVMSLLGAKGRGREMPPPVLISSVGTINALARDIPGWVHELLDQFWPGPLTVVCNQQSSLQWDLGDTRGTVAVRMPKDDVTLELLGRTGPLAVSSANISGQPAAVDAMSANDMLGPATAVILDAGPSPAGEGSTILDCTQVQPRILREGALKTAALEEALTALDVELGKFGDPTGPQ
jgi:tRNA threonylcarbamoyl adenosine modification protein (Sua5/YciO/YrdC/YwlC family)